ncbi:tellurite resistance TerB family protein [Marinobacter hydrocarbonoclasticus]|uniref:tellurite resistance TerB family protein n=1 Tax=Marinobacter nauticus TaxID=2743 RepID=UPI001C93A401|nr:tellurite resistance TerB family protein [Marinobacter nauticus]MBY6194496.1 tellurite resistance TerB family protein [Marinobacter nauticus]MBY6215644.1 tellurite resistance TerB family protein [Marinobacter nauticus]
MNVMSVLNQIMNQAQGGQSRQGSQGGMNVNQMMGNLGNQLSGGKSGSGIDVKSLLGGGALGLMLGSKRGRKMGGKALKYGALAGVGVLAWKAYQNYQSTNQGQAQPAPVQQGHPLEQLQGADQERRGLEILQAMIMAARADGHIDANERQLLTQEIERLGPDDELQSWIQQQFDAPLDASTLARNADSPQAAREIYVVSAVMIDEQNPMERAWLEQLAGALKIEPNLARELEQQVLAAS